MVERLLLNEASEATGEEAGAYLRGAAHDATLSARHGTTRFCQREVAWLEVLRELLQTVGKRSWIYKEGRERSVWVLESTWRASEVRSLARRENAAYLRGYFDAEGGVPASADARFYVQLAQKDRQDLSEARRMLIELGIACGNLHNPSVRVDPDYWRFYVASRSHADFIAKIGSWHPRKRARLEGERRRLAAEPS